MLFANWFMLLVGAGAVGIPIALHLLLRPQPQQIVFPAVRFLKPRQQTNQRQLRWRHWLLLALRCLILLVLAMAFARPHIASAALSNWVALSGGVSLSLVFAVCWVLALSRRVSPWLTRILGGATVLGLILSGAALVQIWRYGAEQAGWGTRQSPVAAAFVVDTAPRMLYRHQGLTRLDRVHELLEELLPQFPTESQFVVVDRPDHTPTFTQDRPGILDQIDSIEPSTRGISLLDRTRRAIQLLKTNTLEQKEIYVLSDLTSSSWPDLNAEAWQAELAQVPGVKLHVVDVGIPQPQNTSLVDVRPVQERSATGGSFEVIGVVRHRGPATTCRVEWLLEQPDPTKPYVKDGKLELPTADVRSQTEVKFTDDGEQEIRWTASGLPPGLHHGRVRLVPSDALPIDDEAYFTLEVQPSWRVAVIEGPRAISRFLVAALGDATGTGQGSNSESRFACSVFSQAGQLPDRWHEFSVVALLDPEPPSDAQWNSWRDYVTQGGRLVICLGRNARAEQFNSLAALSVLPGPLARLWRTDGVLMEPTSDAHPTHRIFQRYPTTVPWDTMPVFRHWTLGAPRPAAALGTPTSPSSDTGSDSAAVDTPASAVAAENSVAAGGAQRLDLPALTPSVSVQVPWRFSNQQPAVIESTLGQGKIIIITTPLSDASSDTEAWNYLPTGLEAWPFLVFVDEWFNYLCQQDAAPLNYQVAQAAAIAVAKTSEPVRYQLFTPRGEWQEVAPQANTINLTINDDPGTYRIRASNPELPVRGFSTNLTADAGLLDRVPADQLETWRAAVNAHIANSETKLERAISEARVGVDFLAYLLVVLAVLLFLESLLAARFYPTAPATAPVATGVTVPATRTV